MYARLLRGKFPLGENTQLLTTEEFKGNPAFAKGRTDLAKFLNDPLPNGEMYLQAGTVNILIYRPKQAFAGDLVYNDHKLLDGPVLWHGQKKVDEHFHYVNASWSELLPVSTTKDPYAPSNVLATTPQCDLSIHEGH